MSHLDEGTLHALLDGELEMTEVKEIQAHLGSCTACGTRLRQVKEFYAEADRLVATLEPGPVASPGSGRARGTEAPAGRLERGDAPAGRTERAAAAARPPIAPEGPPILLIPDNPDWAERSRRLMAPMKWAAVLAVAVGAGFIANEVRRGRTSGSDLAPDGVERTATPVLSPEEATPSPPEGAVTGGARQRNAPADSPPRAASRAAPAPSLGPAEAAKTRPEPKPATPPPPAAQPLAAAADESPDEVVDSAIEANDQVVALANRRRQEASQQPTSAPAAQTAPAAANVRSEAARALEELDRERRVARAAAATAALDSARRRDEGRRPPVTTAPPQRTLEQRAETYLRIGLDEAARQLGRPVHVIEGMSPLFMGLAQGRTSPGADVTRPVVRVVYQDAQGRLILLDQQRIRPAQDTAAPGPAEPHWVMGEILLHLHGEIGPEVLRNMRARVR